MTLRTALVTGAARRIGRAIAVELARAGIDVVAHYWTSESDAAQLAEAVVAVGGRCKLVRADLERDADVEVLVERAASTVGRPIDVLVNNAALFPADTIATVTRESFMRCLAVNAWAPLVLARALARQTSEGHVVNLLDAKIDGYRFTHVGYQASKHVLALMTRMLALELAPGIVVNAVAPGLVLPPPGRDEAWLERQARALVPLRRSSSPEEVAATVLWLLRSTALTGQVIYVDGGSHLLEPADGPHPDP